MEIPDRKVKGGISCPHQEWHIFNGDEILKPWDIFKEEFNLKEYNQRHECDEMKVLQDRKGLKMYFFAKRHELADQEKYQHPVIELPDEEEIDVAKP